MTSKMNKQRKKTQNIKYYLAKRLLMWMTVKEASIFLNIKDKTIYYFVHHGLIPHYRIGKMVRFNKEEIDHWMKSKKAGTMTTQVEKIVRSAYTPSYGRPDHLKKEVG